MFINLTNHPSASWSEAQLAAARQYGSLVDLSFPSISPTASREDVAKMAAATVSDIMSREPNAVLCEGEFAFTYNVVNSLKECGITVLAACSERSLQDLLIDGQPKTVKMYEFKQFREY